MTTGEVRRRPTVSQAPVSDSKRELYLDALRAAAIVRVVTYHAFGGSWLTWLFPAIGVMFALAGGLMVRSLDRQPPLTVIRRRLRRLLPALWLFGAIVVPLMLAHGWADDEDSPLSWPTLLYWILPVFDPPGSTWGENATVVLWYLRTYLWLVALSPLLLKAFRRWPVPTMVTPLIIVIAAAFGLIPGQSDGDVWDLLISLGIYTPCWLLGFAHRTGQLYRVSKGVLLSIAAGCAAAGAAWALTHPGDDPMARFDLNSIPLADALWSIAVVLPLLRFAPEADWIGRTPYLGRFVALLNNRAVTIYIWHNVMIDLSFVVEGKLEEVIPGAASVAENPLWNFAVVWALIAICVASFGWIEDLAARRKPRLFPVGPSSEQQRAEHRMALSARPTAAEPEPQPAVVDAGPAADLQRHASRADRSPGQRYEPTPAGDAMPLPLGQPVTPIRAIGVAGEEVRIAPAVFGAREIAWSAHPAQCFRPGTEHATHARSASVPTDAGHRGPARDPRAPAESQRFGELVRPASDDDAHL